MPKVSFPTDPPFQPAPAAVAMPAQTVTAVAAPGRRGGLPAPHRLCLSAITLLLLGFVLGGRGFAHLGVPPVFVGDVTLALCVCLFLSHPVVAPLLRSRVVLLLVLFDAFGFARTVPFLDEFGGDALRDGVLYGYSLFALMIGATLAEEHAIRAFLALFDKASTIAVILLPVFLAVSELSPPALDPTLPLVTIKSGDAAVHLAGFMAFRLLGLHTLAREGRSWPFWLDALFWVCAIGTTIWTISATRSGMAAILVTLLIVVLAGHGRHRMVLFATITVAALLFLSAFGTHVERDRRDFSAAQIIANATTLATPELGGGQDGRVDYMDMQSTIQWRLAWWSRIVDYTILGDYFWAGRGFGLNLADADGFQTNPLAPLRSPHNAMMTVLARMGVPGLTLWISLLASFAAALLRTAVRMRACRAIGWDRLCLWILSFWAACLVNGSFDVYLEGPQGGIWFWSIFGLGLAVLDVTARTGPLPPSPAPGAVEG